VIYLFHLKSKTMIKYIWLFVALFFGTLTISYSQTSSIHSAIEADSKIYPFGDSKGDSLKWESLKDMNTPRWMHSASVFGGKIYVFGGLMYWIHNRGPGSIVLNSVEVYDPKSDTWSDCAPMPTARTHLTTSIVDGKIYAIGGMGKSPNYSTLATVEIYDPISDSWVKGTDMPLPRLECHSSVYDGKIYVFGGLNDSWEGLNRVEVYDPELDTWTSLANMPTARGALSSIEKDGLIYVLGGISVADAAIPALKANEVYNPTTDTWEELGEMPTGKSHFGAVIYNERIYTIGGSSLEGPEIMTRVEVFDISENIWLSAPDMPTARVALTCSLTNGKIYAIGGENDTVSNWPGLTTVEALAVGKYITIVQPACDTSLISPAEIILKAETQAGNDTVEIVEFYNGTEKIGEVLAEPFSIAWSGVLTGDYDVTAVMIDSNSDTIHSYPVHITVTASAPPSVFITEPSEHSNFPENSDVTIIADASDIDGSIESVAFYNGDQKLGESNSEPYSFIWTGVPVGSHSVSAVATDDSETNSASAPVQFTMGECYAGSNLLSNAEFDNGTSGWRISPTVDNIFTISDVQDARLSGANALWVNITKASFLSGMRLSRRFNFESAKTYRICFMAKAERPKKIKLALAENSLYASEFWSQEVMVDTIADTYGPFFFTSEVDYSDGEIKFCLGSDTSDIWLDKIVITDGKIHPPAKPTVRITSPADGATYNEGDNVRFVFYATDDWGEIIKLELYNGSEKQVETKSESYTYVLRNLSAGNYEITAVATNDNSVSGTSSVVHITVNPDTTTNLQLNDFTVLNLYPNPSGDVINIETGIAGCYSVEITTLNGQLIFSGDMDGTTYQIDLLSFQKGVYFITIRSKDFVTTRKIIKL
jgi:N-acetylneuraminic acid mutarotase